MSVIFSRAPLRISLGGGGTDLPSYYREHGGFLVAGAIDKYVYMLMHTVFQRRYRMKYSETEEVDEIAEIRHPILRETLQRHWRGNPLEIASVADVPAGTGMGSSGRVHGLPAQGARPRAAHVDHARARSPRRRARSRSTCSTSRSASRTIRRRARRHLRLHVRARRHRRASSRSSSRPRRCAACASSCCCSTPARRARASAVLADQDERTKTGDAEMLENLHRTKELGHQSRELLEQGDLIAYAELMHEHWQNKRQRSPGMANERIDDLYTLARRSGASAASSSAPAAAASCSSTPRNPADTRQAMAAAGAPELPVRLRVRRRLRRASTHEPDRARAVAIVGCGLIGHKRADALGAEDELVGCHRRRRRRGASVSWQTLRRSGVRATSTSCSRSAPTSSIVATTHDQLADDRPSAALAAGAHVLVEKPAGLGTATDRAAHPGRSGRAAGWSRSASTTASTRHRPRWRAEVHSGAPRRAAAPAGALRPRRPARLRPRVAGRPGALGRRRARSTRACTCST